PTDEQPPTNQQVREFLGEVRAAVRGLADLADQREWALEIVPRRTSEEVDLLWWVLEPWSDGLSSPWSSAGVAAVAATGVEIARRLMFSPPPRGIAGFARRALHVAGAS